MQGGEGGCYELEILRCEHGELFGLGVLAFVAFVGDAWRRRSRHSEHTQEWLPGQNISNGDMY